MPDGMTIALPSRERVENAIEALVALLDEIDAPTEDMEEDDPLEDEHDQEGIVDEMAPDYGDDPERPQYNTRDNRGRPWPRNVRQIDVPA